MPGFGRKQLSISDKEYELIDEQVSELLRVKQARLVGEEFLVAGGTSVFIREYRIDGKSLAISCSDDGIVNISGQRNIVDSIMTLLTKIDSQ